MGECACPHPTQPFLRITLAIYSTGLNSIFSQKILLLLLLSSTLIDSTPGVLKAWDTFGADYKLPNPAAVAHATHGRRLYDTLKEYCGITAEDLIQVSEFPSMLPSFQVEFNEFATYRQKLIVLRMRSFLVG